MKQEELWQLNTVNQKKRGFIGNRVGVIKNYNQCRQKKKRRGIWYERR